MISPRSTLYGYLLNDFIAQVVCDKTENPSLALAVSEKPWEDCFTG